MYKNKYIRMIIVIYFFAYNLWIWNNNRTVEPGYRLMQILSLVLIVLSFSQELRTWWWPSQDQKPRTGDSDLSPCRVTTAEHNTTQHCWLMERAEPETGEGRGSAACQLPHFPSLPHSPLLPHTNCYTIGPFGRTTWWLTANQSERVLAGKYLIWGF